MPKKKKEITGNEEVFERTKREATEIARTDKIGTVAKKAIELMQVLITSNCDPEKVFFAVESLKRERELVIEWDNDTEKPIRKDLYKFFAALEEAMQFYAEREKRLLGEMEVKKEEESLANSNTVTPAASLFSVSGYESGGRLKKVKEEEDEEDARKNKKTKKPPMDSRKKRRIKEEEEDEEESRPARLKKKNVEKSRSETDDESMFSVSGYQPTRRMKRVKEEVEDGEEDAPPVKRKTRKTQKPSSDSDDDSLYSVSGFEPTRRTKRIKKEKPQEDSDDDSLYSVSGYEPTRRMKRVKEELHEDDEEEDVKPPVNKKKKVQKAESKTKQGRKRYVIKEEIEEEQDEAVTESSMAKRVREKLIRKYADCFPMSFEDPIWFRDEAASLFYDWVDYWESEEGEEKGGPPKAKEMDLTLEMKRDAQIIKSEAGETPKIPKESDMAKDVRAKLKRDYADCGMALGDSIWLKDEDAVKFQSWMEYWESEEGRKKGGPTKISS